MSTQRTIGQAIAEQISGYTFTGDITSVAAVYERRFDYTFADLSQRRVSVVPGPVSVGPEGGVPQAPRGADWFGHTFAINIASHVANDADVEQLEDLCKEIMDAIRSNHLDVGEGVDWMDLSMPLPFDPASLQDRSVFLAQIVVTYMVAEAKVSAPTPTPPEE
jgi:hypothetical protein